MSGFDEKRIVAKHDEPTLTPLEPRAGYTTGNAYADRGMQCDVAPFAGCFLGTAQRSRIVEMFHGRVGLAHSCYLAACEQLRVGELLAKTPGRGLLFEAILEIVGMVATGALGKLFRGVQTSMQRVVTEAQLDYQTASSAVQSLAAADARSVDQVLKSISTLTKKHVGKAPDPDTTVAVAFLDDLTNQAGPMYETISEQAPAAATDDVQLLLLFEAFAAPHHTVSEYKDQIAAKLERFKGTHLGQIGTHEGHPEDFEPDASTEGSMARPRRLHDPDQGGFDIKLFVVDTMGVKRIGLYRREFKHAINAQHLAAPWLIPPIQVEQTMGYRAEYASMTDDDYKFVEFVPDEFTDAAVRAHVAKWGHQPTQRTDLLPWSKP